MDDLADPFRHHPRLRDLITDPATSFFRTFNPADYDELARAQGRSEDWRYPDDVRNRMLSEFLDTLPPGDLWVFAYGSLLWDPGFHFTEIRRAHAAGYERRFILYDTGARGSQENPAVMAALDIGDGCDGLVFRIAGSQLAEELEILWRREKIAPAYDPVMIEVTTDHGPVRALAFVANHDSPDIRPDLTRDEQVHALATAKGEFGDNLDYILNLKRHFSEMQISDPHVDDLHDAAVKEAKKHGLWPR